MEFSFRSEQGSLSRNEDLCLTSESRGLFLVCDGLSVKEGGDVAAAKAGEILRAWAEENASLIERAKASGKKEDRKSVEDSLAGAITTASRAIFQLSATSASMHGMCTSLDVILLLGSHALVAHVGAGRIYLVRKGEAHLLTEDHTQFAHLRRTGKIGLASPQQIAAYARRLTRAVGYQEDVKADTLVAELQAGDRFVAMSDGVWQPVGDATIFSLAAKPLGVKELVELLQRTVNETGARDNFTTLVLDPKWEAAEVPAGAEQKLKMLGKVPAFEYLAYQELLKVLSIGDLVKVGAGQVLCREGDAGGEMMLLISGAATVTKEGSLFRTLGPGDVFGEMSMIDSAPRSATVVTSNPTNLLAFPRETLFSLFREDSNLAVKFLWGISTEMNHRLREASNRIVGQSENEGAPANRKGALPFHRSI